MHRVGIPAFGIEVDRSDRRGSDSLGASVSYANAWNFGGRRDDVLVGAADDGFRVQGLRTGNPIQGAQFAGDFFATSLGLNYRGPGNLIVRSEIRYDWYDGEANAGAGGARPFDDGAQNDQLSGGVDLIIEF